MFDKKIPLIEYHWSRLAFTADVISATLPSKFDIAYLEGLILDLASVNDAARNARVRIQFFRKGKGLYWPEDKELGFAMTMQAISNNRFEAGAGLIAGIRDDCFKDISMISDIKASGSLMYVLAAGFARKEGWDECILTNPAGHICEMLSGNIFITKGSELMTPTLDSGCINGVMRNWLMSMPDVKAIERDFEVEDLINADEILLTNAVRGVQWIKQLEGKQYGNTKAIELSELLNQHLIKRH
jgi:branched-chain amino acid aminotransferase